MKRLLTGTLGAQIACAPVAALEPASTDGTDGETGVESDTETKDPLVYEESFDTHGPRIRVDHGSDDSDASVEVIDGRLHVTTSPSNDGVIVWLDVELPDDFRLEFEVEPVNDYGAQGFNMLWWGAEGTDGTDIFDPSLWSDPGPSTMFVKYCDWEIRGYYFSYRRSPQQTVNARACPGKQLRYSEPGPILEAGVRHRIALERRDSAFTLFWNDEAIAQWSEPMPVRGGRIGLRQVYATASYYDDLRVMEL